MGSEMCIRDRYDGSVYEAEMVAGMAASDVAVLKITPSAPVTSFRAIEFAEDDDLLLGESVLALGNPFGLGSSVSRGILSSKNRRPPTEDQPLDVDHWLQTDAAINPGNSGGPLVNLEGRLMGLNVAVYKEAQGIGFAIPINLARRVADQLQQQGEVVHPYIGLQLVALTPRIAREHNKDPNALVQLPERSGALVQAVLPDGPAEKAGLRRGDLLITVDERDIADPQALLEVVDAAAIDVPLPLKVLRAGRELTLSVKPEPLPGMA